MSSPLVDRTEPIPGYKLLERLGSGGFGEVWKCEAPGGIQKAIKFVYGDMEASGDESTLADREYKALERIKQVRHPFILSLERYDIVDGRLFILTELADCNLWDRFREYRNKGQPGIPREELLRYLHEAAEALDMMNEEHQLQHLDIKPQNLFLVHRHIKVADFGMTKVFEGMRATITGGVTPVYAAPETFEGWISRHCDQYSLAIVYQELLTGVRPFNGSNTKQLLLQHLTAAPNLMPLPEADRQAVGRALSKKPDERFSSCLELIETLQRAMPGIAPRNGHSSTVPLTAPQSPPNSRLLPPRPRESSLPPVNGAAPQTLERPSVTPGEPTPHPTELTGPGVLQPTVIIGVGGLGGRVVQALHSAMADRFGDPAAISSLRFLALDTDGDALAQLTGARKAPLPSDSSAHLKLHRASHYAGPESPVAVDAWLDRNLLFRMPRAPATMGIRAFGRLAFLGHRRLVAGRLKTLLEAVLTPSALADADRATGLGLRTNRPRVVVVAGIGGGGSGMITDLAYLAMATLKSLGCADGDMAGVLLAPPTDAKPHALANACATLTEIEHFGRSDSQYELRMRPRDPVHRDSAPPFHRITIVPMAPAGEENATRLAIGQAAGLLIDEMLTPAGRCIETARRDAHVRSILGTTAEVAATYRIAWPRTRLIRRAALRLTERILKLWTSKDHAQIRPSVAEWLEEQWTSRRLQPELLIERLHEACAAAVGQDPETKLDAAIAPLKDRAALGTRLDGYSACAVLDDVLELVGKPLFKGEAEHTPGLLQKIIGESTKPLADEYDKKLAEMAVHFIEQPGLRMAAAEETIHQLTARLQQFIKTYETIYFSLEREVSELYKRLFPLIGQLDTGALGARRSTTAAEVIELLRAYPKKRFQSMVAGFALSTYRGMLGAAPEFLREVNYCRERLGECASLVQRASADVAVSTALGPGRDFFPGGGSNVEDAARSMADELSEADLQAFDERLQGQLRKTFKSLVNWCLDSGCDPAALLDAIQQQAAAYLSERLGAHGPADVFFQHFGGDDQAAHRALAAVVEDTMPHAATRSGATGEMFVLAVPKGQAGDRLFEMVEQALPGEQVIRAEAINEIVFRREFLSVPFTDLAPLGTAARDAYRNLLTSETPPHSRCDIKWIVPQK